MLIAAFIITQLGVEIPKYDKRTSTILTVLISGVIFLLISLTVQKVSDIEGGPDKNKLKFPKEVLGMVVSAIFSVAISSMIYFHIRDGISFVTWGVSFGILMSIMFLSSQKILLGLLYFLEPSSAENLYEIMQLKRSAEERKISQETRKINTMKVEDTSTATGKFS